MADRPPVWVYRLIARALEEGATASVVRRVSGVVKDLLPKEKRLLPKEVLDKFGR